MTTAPRVRVALIGAGMVGRAHAHAYRALHEILETVEVQLAVVADADEALAADAERRYGFERRASSWETVAEARDVDAVSVALPNFQHREVAEALLASGKHVLCEKPLAPNARDAWALLQAARRAGVVHAVGFNLRRAPCVAAIQHVVARGELGQPQQFLGRYLTDYAASPETPFTWRYVRAKAGSGALGDVGSHIIDLAHFLLGPIERILGADLATYVPRRPIPAGHVIGHAHAATTGEFGSVDTDDVASFTARFQNGAVGQIACSRIATGYRNVPAFELIGSRGAASFDMERPAEFQIFRSDEGDASGFRRVVASPAHPYFAESVVMSVAGVGYGYRETFVGQALEFIRAIAGQRQIYAPSFEDGYRAALVCEAVQEAAEQGRAVSLAEVAARAESA